MQNRSQNARELLKILRARGCAQVRQKGSHIRVRCGGCSTTVPTHKGEDLGRGLLAQIERDLQRCLDNNWLNRKS
jgi:predicted RNA binding protein YcfA (HicA-like mRNA interferase family)